jgi:SAM-dependent methyltransferase
MGSGSLEYVGRLPGAGHRSRSLSRDLLGIPTIYSLFQRAARGDADRVFVSQYVQPRPGDRILDIGCGPADILRHMPAVDYLGFDSDPRFVKAARTKYGLRGEFWCQRVGSEAINVAEAFDIGLAVAILHHLSDQEAYSLLEFARKVLKPEGRLLTWDPCLVHGQSSLSRLLMSRDRGEFVRSREDYERIVIEAGACVESWVHTNLLRLPLPSIIMRVRF